MIVRPEAGRLLLITQPDHAHLARDIMEHCVELSRRPRRASILDAIGEHDNGWTEDDAAPTLNPATGEVADFVTAPVRMRQAVWPRGVGRLAHDPFAAALVAQHAITVYDRYQPDPDWTAFFAEMEALRTTMLHASGLPLDALLADYPFVRLGDLVSLTFCTGWTDEQRHAGWTVAGSDSRVTVAPDPFAGAAIPFQIRAKVLHSQMFRSDAELRGALAHADTVTLQGEVAATRFAS